MAFKKSILLTFTHVFTLLAGIAIGIFTLPILIAPDGPDGEELAMVIDEATYIGRFDRERQDSDLLHWGEGDFAINDEKIVFVGELAPGPDYKIYLSSEFVESEAQFNQLKANMVQVGAVDTFTNFSSSIPSDIDLSQYNTVIVWCESFGEFITSGTYHLKGA